MLTSVAFQANKGTLGHVASQGPSVQASLELSQMLSLAFRLNWPVRYCCLSGLTSIMREERFTPTKKDMRFMKHISHDTKEGILEQVQASFSHGFASWVLGDRETAARSYRHAIQTARQATQADKSRTVVMPDMQTLSYHPTPAGPLIAECLDGAVSNLAVLEQRSTGAPPTTQDEKKRKDAWPEGLSSLSSHYFKVAVPRSTRGGDQDLLAQLVRQGNMELLFDVGGSKCDQCGLLAPTTGVTSQDGKAAAGHTHKLKRCGRCRLLWLCSTECQKTAWKSNHSKECCLPDKFKVGDIVRLHKLQKKPELNNTIVTVEGVEED
eukprot:g13880.t1